MKELKINGVDVTVEFYHQPFEPAETGPEAQYPGCPEEIDVESVMIKGVDITALLSDQLILEIGQVILNGDSSN